MAGGKGIAVVTAAARGIGRHTAATLKREGWDVVITDIAADAGASAKDDGLIFRPCDMGDVAAVEALFAEFPAVEVLVNNTGVLGPAAPVWKTPLDEWRHCLELNLTVHFLCCKLVLPGMIERGCGVIVNMSSVAGTVGWPTRSAYSASKWGVIGLTKTLAREVGAHGIRVNAICPGAVRGERIEQGIAAYAEAAGVSLEAARVHYMGRQAVPDFVGPEEIAETIAFLAGDKARSITGAVIHVAGGFE